MQCRFLAGLACLLLATHLSASDARIEIVTPADRGLTADNLHFYVYLPANYDENTETQYPLLIFLHGAGEQGTNMHPNVIKNGPLKPLYDNGSINMAKVDQLDERVRNSIVIAPRSPAWWPSRRAYMNTLLVHNLDEYRIDQDRIYLTGLSAGGSGTWMIGVDYPDYFAALLPVCGSDNDHTADDHAPRLYEKNIPVWAFHGEKDPNGDDEDFGPDEHALITMGLMDAVIGTVSARSLRTEVYPGSVSEDRSYIFGDSDWSSSSGVVMPTTYGVTVYDEAGHSIWGRTYNNPDVYAWLYNQSKDGPIDNSTISGTVTLDGAGLNGATITYTGPTNGFTTTATDGSYSFSAPDGEYSIVASKDGYLTTASATATTPPDQTAVDFTFTTATITGIVRNTATNSPIAGATITYTGELSGSATSDADGSYSINRVFGRSATLTLQAAKAGFQDSGSMELAVPPNKTQDFDLDPALAGTITLPGAHTDVDEDAGSIDILIRRINGNDGDVSVYYETVTDTATADDFTPISGTLEWLNGNDDDKTVTVDITNDTAHEGDERFEFRLSSPTGGAELGNDLQEIIIGDDDSPPPGNNPPEITSGPDADPASVVMPNGSVLSVTATDADADALNYSWNKVSGPGAVLFSVQAATSTASFDAPGDYILSVTVTDGNGGSDSGSVEITVLADSTPAQAPASGDDDDGCNLGFGGLGLHLLGVLLVLAAFTKRR